MKSISSEIEKAQLEIAKANEILRNLKEEEKRLLLAIERDRTRSMTTATSDALRELIADAAREHGSQCAKLGKCETTPAWARFRILLAELARRAGSTDV